MSYLPSREADLVNWTANFSSVIEANPSAYGLTAEQATAYLSAMEAYQSAYNTARNPSTRTPAAIETKNTFKAQLLVLTREFVNICQAYPDMTNNRRVQLGITVRNYEPTPVPIPTTPPQIDLLAAIGHTFKLRLHNGESTRRSKPTGVQGATVFSYVGEVPPADLSDWKFEGSTTRTAVDVKIPGTVAPGTKVWLTAFWYNRRAESGPACTPIASGVGFGGVSQAA